jgi:hypothetical protein
MKRWIGEGVVKTGGIFGGKTFIGRTKAVRISYNEYLKTCPVGMRFRLTVTPLAKPHRGRTR